MRIAQVAPLHESVPPRLYGGTERVVSHLTEELVRMGHEVTLFASGDSVTAAELVPVCPRALRLDPDHGDAIAQHVLALERVRGQANRFDLVHFHIDYLHLPLARALGLPHVTTLHGRLDAPDLVPFFREFADMPFVSISDAQREPLRWVDWRATVHHGLPPDLLQPCAPTTAEEHGGYLAFLGRVSPEKGLDRAVAIAQATGMELHVAAKVDRFDREYFEAVVRPLLDDPLVRFVGEIGDDDKNRFLGRAAALLFPIDWPEPFGLVMIEAMACGTPVVAYRRGSTPEIVDEGITGFIVDTEDEAVVAIRRLSTLSRTGCRQRFEERFTARRMANEYVAVYQQLCRALPAREGWSCDSATNAG